MDPQQQHDITILTIFMGGIKHQIVWSVFSIASIESHMGIYIIFDMYSQLFDDYMNMEYTLIWHMPSSISSFWNNLLYFIRQGIPGNRETRRVGSVGGMKQMLATQPRTDIYTYVYIYIHMYIYMYIYISISIKQPLYDYGWMGLFLNVQASIVILTSTHTHIKNT